MIHERRVTPRRRLWIGALALLAAGYAGPVVAGTPTDGPAHIVFVDDAATAPAAKRAVGQAVYAPPATAESTVVQVDCKSCANGLLGRDYSAPRRHCHSCGGCGASDGCAPCGQCIPGRDPCCCIDAHSAFGRFWAGLYECICCPDPCYDARWVAGANAAFFVDAARPVTQSRIRWDNGLRLIFPDRSEYFWARADGNGKGPNRIKNLGPVSADHNRVSLYTEAGSGRASVFTDMPYIAVDADFSDGSHFRGSGFGDLIVGTKAMLLDCELIQFTFQFSTTIPTGSPGEAVSIGHTALEPSFLMAIKLTRQMYLQAQIAEWFSVGGDKAYQGSVLHYHTSLNYVIPLVCDVELVATGEFNGYTFQGGAKTDPFTPNLDANGNVAPIFATGDSALSAGPGLRLVVCNKIDFGMGTAFALTHDHTFQSLYRFEFRWRF